MTCLYCLAKLCYKSLTSVLFSTSFATYYNIMLYCTIQVLSSNSLQNKLENIDTQNLVQHYLQLHDNIKVIKQLIKKYFVINKVKNCIVIALLGYSQWLTV